MSKITLWEKKKFWNCKVSSIIPIDWEKFVDSYMTSIEYHFKWKPTQRCNLYPLKHKNGRDFDCKVDNQIFTLYLRSETTVGWTVIDRHLAEIDLKFTKINRQLTDN